MLQIGNIHKFTYPNFNSFIGICLDILESEVILGILNMDFKICSFDINELEFEEISIDENISKLLVDISVKYSERKSLLLKKNELNNKKDRYIINLPIILQKLNTEINNTDLEIQSLDKDIKNLGIEVQNVYLKLNKHNFELLSQKNLHIGEIKRFTFKSFSNISFIGICIEINIYNCERCDYICETCPYNLKVEGHDLNSVRSYIVLSINRENDSLSLEEMDLDIGNYFIEPVVLNKDITNHLKKVGRLYIKQISLQKEYNTLKSSHMDFGINQKRYQQLYSKLTKQISLNDRKLNQEKFILFQNLEKYK